MRLVCTRDRLASPDVRRLANNLKNRGLFEYLRRDEAVLYGELD